ncbi:pyrimidine/purine nucleoside phosphorylase [Vibrio sp.]|uniref:Pyrimidine/purine nucleoside phosphorylase n=1 Tax=Vibrio viridaestus TaxID=2487322 RepID=A0A3N9U9J0_9VIBR|nr:pyrimidine/purine nucleoside phosphorylase [Vibrio viridaestus]MDC0611961.1 pyrimidine/purine nucleoside phosphorylase [Vibrio sp.]RQW64896.1 pyrimidine/purine nucleoside phosphorylase [Vibrio viridaestus]
MIKENRYFDDQVKSLGFEQKGEALSVGVMEKGEYTFGTAAAEKMTVVTGALTVKLPGSDEWATFVNGQAFDVPSDSSFDVKVEEPTAYLCEYIK